MNSFVLKGFSRPAFFALIANQIILVTCALQKSALTPIFAIICTVVHIYWDWRHTNWITSFTPGKSKCTVEDRKQIWIGGLVMAAPMLWLAVPYSVGRLREEMSVDLALNAVCLAAIVAVCLSGYFKHVRI